jgi:hypothetical protein
MQSDFKPEGLAAQAARRGAVLKMQVAMDEVKAKGVDPTKLGLKIPTAEPMPTLENLPEYLAGKRAELLNAQVTAALDAAEQLVAAQAKMKAAGIDPESLVHRGPPTYRAADHLAQLQKAAGGRVPLDAAKVGPKLVQLEAMARSSYLATAHEQPPAKPMPPERAKVLRDAVQRAHADGKSPGSTCPAPTSPTPGSKARTWPMPSCSAPVSPTRCWHMPTAAARTSAKPT